MYLITYILCKKQYVEQTQNQLQIRTICHKYDFRHKVDTPVANHFNLPGHLLEEHFEIVIIEQPPILGSKTKSDLLRLEREAFCIRTLETKKPFGIKVESGKSTERDKIIFPLIYNRCNVDIGKIMKDEYLHLQNFLLLSTRLPTNPVTL